jgi:hypothetical protein
VIVFFVGRESRVVLTSYLRTWGSRLLPKVQFVYYEDFPHLDVVPAAHAYVFTDLERRLAERPRLARLADRLAASPGVPRILNHPRRVLGRYELLRILHDRRVNPFDIHRLDGPVAPRFPVFVRDPDEHHGPVTPILSTREELERELERLRREGMDVDSLVAIEYEETRREDGLFRKYVTYVLGDEILHGNLVFSRDWVAKHGGADSPALLAEQAAALRELADLAGVRYGRFDYAVVDGQLRIWELNTNPRLLYTPDGYTEEVLLLRRPLADRITAALDGLDGCAPAAVDRPPVPLRDRGARRLLGSFGRSARPGPR